MRKTKPELKRHSRGGFSPHRKVNPDKQVEKQRKILGQYRQHFVVCHVQTKGRRCRELMQTADLVGMMPHMVCRETLVNLTFLLATSCRPQVVWWCFVLVVFCFLWSGPVQRSSVQFLFTRLGPRALVNWLFTKKCSKGCYLLIRDTSHFSITVLSYIHAAVSTVDSSWFQYEGHKGSVHGDHREAVQQRMTIAAA